LWPAQRARGRRRRVCYALSWRGPTRAPWHAYAQTFHPPPANAPTREDRSWGPFSALSDSGLGAEAGRRDLAPAIRPTSPGDSWTILCDRGGTRSFDGLLLAHVGEGWEGLRVGQRLGPEGVGSLEEAESDRRAHRPIAGLVLRRHIASDDPRSCCSSTVQFGQSSSSAGQRPRR
jgi:hypothetical protein